jgi:hypothetical protein
MEDEALLRYPETDGMHDGHRCVCTSECPAVCDGAKCQCEACLRAWMDAGLDELIGTKLGEHCAMKLEQRMA